MRRLPLFFALLGSASITHASETPLYQPVPAWVKPAPAIDVTTAAAPDAPQVVVYDTQQRIEGDSVWSYSDTAQRATTAESLDNLGTLAFPWSPDKGDLIVHRVEIIRGADHIDLLKAGGKFSVLRREEGLEKRMLSGMLTATMPVEGLRVGDILHVTVSTVQRDAALKGRAQTYMPLLAEPFRATYARGRIVWPASTPLHLAALTDAVAVKPVTVGTDREFTVTMPLAEFAPMPGDAPMRYRKLGLLEASSFADWPDVSRTLAPLFATDGLIVDGSPLAGEADAITKAAPDPLHRAELALELVQSKIRYLLMGMNGGNYVPEKPANTWTSRYGDCKAKTLLLLALLHRMGIEAEPVLVNAQAGGMLPQRLPAPGAFDHVLVRATIAGQGYWLDGTDSGARFEDITDTPGFRYGLPLTMAGASLMPIAIHARARPDFTLAMELDERAGIGLPIPYTATIGVRGQPAEALATAAGQATAVQKRQIITKVATQFVGDGQLASGDLHYDATTGIATITASGLLDDRWSRDDRRYRQTIDAAVSKQSFAPDRARAAWQAIPVATTGPGGMTIRTRVLLPDDGRGFTLEGDRTLPATLAGVTMARTVTLDRGVATSDDRMDETGVEIAPADLPQARAAYAAAGTRLLRLVAPADYAAGWQVAKAARASGATKPIEDAYTRVIAADPKEDSGYRSRASFRAGVYDREGAIADWTKVIALSPDVGAYVARSQLYGVLGQTDKALADASAAYAVDPSSTTAIYQLADMRSEKGETDKAVALIQAGIDAGGKDKYSYIATKAGLQATAGDVAGGLATLDAAIAERPGLPDLLNSRCWLKGSRNVAVESALKDCTKAIELADNPSAALDSRAMAYFRLGRLDDALADLDSALDNDPNLSGSLFLRGIVQARRGKATEAAEDLAAARFITPRIDVTYAKFGIKP